MFGEARDGVLRGDGAPSERDADEAFCLLGQLLVGADAEPGVLDALNARLVELDASAREYYLPGTREPNPRFVSDDAFFWGLPKFDQPHPQWLALVVERFPRSSVALELETTRAKVDRRRSSSSACERDGVREGLVVRVSRAGRWPLLGQSTMRVTRMGSSRAMMTGSRSGGPGEV